MSRPHPDLSVIVCTHSSERWEDLERAMGSLAAQSLQANEVVLVVDHNAELHERACRRWPDVVVVENRERPGLSGARNTGVASSSGALLAFLDDDAVAAVDWLERLVRRFSDGDSVIGVGGTIEPDWVSGRPPWFPPEFDWVVGCSYVGLPLAPAAVRNVIGANMSFRREVFDEVGGFRTEVGRVGSVPAGCEETELCIRAGRRWPERLVLYDPLVRVRHRVPPRRGEWSYFLSRCFAEGRSKAVVARLAGAVDATSTERSYAIRVLPAGVARGLRDALTGRDRAGWGRAGAIVAGLSATAAGFLLGRVRSGPSAA